MSLASSSDPSAQLCTVINTIRRPLDLVERSVRSALAQSPPVGAVLLIDQNVEPLPLAADLKSDPRLQHRHVLAPSVSEARNSATLPPACTWILFCDDDGYQQNGYVSHLLEVLGAHPKLDVIAGSILRDDTNEFYTNRQKLGGTLRSFTGTKLLMGSNFCVRRSVFEELGGFDARFGAGSFAGSGEETDFCWACFFAGKQMRYDPGLVVLHIPPFQEDPVLAYRKSYQYGVGKGLLVKKWLFEKRRFTVLWEALEMFAVPIAQWSLALLKRDPSRRQAALGSFLGRAHGLFRKKLVKA